MPPIDPDKYIRQLENAIKDPPIWAVIVSDYYERGFIRGLDYAMRLFKGDLVDEEGKANDN